MTDSTVTHKPETSFAPSGRSSSADPLELIVQVMANESQLIWTRYTSMLTANSLVAVLLAAVYSRGQPSAADWFVLLVGSGFGLVLSAFWLGLTRRGWELSHRWATEARCYVLEHGRNPIDVYEQWARANQPPFGHRDWIMAYAVWAIYLFLAVYFLLASISLVGWIAA